MAALRLEGNKAEQALPFHQIQTMVMGDPVQPSAGRLDGIHLVCIFNRLEENVLNGILGFLPMPQHVVAILIDRLVKLIDKAMDGGVPLAASNCIPPCFGCY